MQELLGIIQEEAEIMDPENTQEVRTRNALYRALDKIGESGPTTVLTPTERDAVKYALEDVGELYLHTGTSAGFDADTVGEENVQEHRSRGRKAREQAAALGIHVG